MIHTLSPENPNVTFRFDDGSENPMGFGAKLAQFEVSAPDAGGKVDGIRIAFDCDAAAYAKIEEQSWFRLRPGLAADLGVTFDPAAPIRIEAAMDALTIETSFLPEFTPDNEKETLAEITAPLYDMEMFGPARSPVAFEFTRVSQKRADGTVAAFTPEDAAKPRKPGQAVITSISVGPTVPVLSAEPRTAAHFAGQVDVRGKLLRIRAEQGDDGPASVSITMAFDGENLASIFEYGFFDCPPFIESSPSKVELDLAPNLLAPCFKQAGSDLQAMLTAAVQALADPKAVSMYGSVTSWVWRE